MENKIRITRFNDMFLASEPWPVFFCVKQKYVELDKATQKILLEERQGLGRPTVSHSYPWSEIVDVRIGEYLDTSDGAPVWIYAVQVVLQSEKRIILSDTSDYQEVRQLAQKIRQFLLNDQQVSPSEDLAQECYR